MLVTFGSAKPKRTESRNTKLDIVLKDGSILTISANVVPQIAESIQRRPVNLRHLRIGITCGKNFHWQMICQLKGRLHL